jgi:hypothetical protein
MFLGIVLRGLPGREPRRSTSTVGDTLADRYAGRMNRLGQILVPILAILIAGTLAYFVASFVLNW